MINRRMVGLGVALIFVVLGGVGIMYGQSPAPVHIYTNVTSNPGHLLVPEGTLGASLINFTGPIGLGKGGSAAFPLDDTWSPGQFTPLPSDHATSFDRLWFQIIGATASATFDLGGPCDTVYIALSQDHGPYPEEGLEYRVGVSNNPAGPFTTLPANTPITIFRRGWSAAGEPVVPWVSEPAGQPSGGIAPTADTLNDDWSALWILPATFRYLRLTPIDATGIYNEPEIDAVICMGALDLFLSGNDVIPVQAVEGVDLDEDGSTDLVLGKPMVVRVTVGISNPDALQTPVKIDLNFQGLVLTKELTKNELLAGPINFYLDVGDFGYSPIIVRIDPDNDINELDENNNEYTKEAIVRNNDDLYVGYIRVGCSGDELGNYLDTVSKAGVFLQGVYPVVPTNFTNKPFEQEFRGRICRDSPWKDAHSIFALANILSFGRVDKVVAIIGPEYAIEHGYPSIGSWAWCGYPVVFVQDDHWDVVAHEIGHAFQLNDLGDSQCKGPASPPKTNGFWGEMAGIEFRDYRSLMNNLAHFTPSEFPQPFGWITREDYSYVFENGFDEVDPEALVLGGVLSKDGQVEWGSFYRLPSADIGGAHAGDYSIQLLDISGGILYEVPFDVSFFVMAHPAIETDVVPFGFVVPYLDGTADVQVVQGDQVLSKTNVTSKLLSDAINAIPDFGFTMNPEQRRNALINKVSEVEVKIQTGDLEGAMNKLKHDIKVHLQMWLLEDYQPENALQYSKQDILTLVVDMIHRLETLE